MLNARALSASIVALGMSISLLGGPTALADEQPAATSSWGSSEKSEGGLDDEKLYLALAYGVTTSEDAAQCAFEVRKLDGWNLKDNPPERCSWKEITDADVSAAWSQALSNPLILIQALLKRLSMGWMTFANTVFNTAFTL